MLQTKEKGITLISLIITIAVMLIVASTTVSISLDRFEVNNYNKMINDLELLKDKVLNYYLKHGELPLVRDDQGNAILYTYSDLDFDRNSKDNENYYIINVELMDGLFLNYGKKGIENINNSKDVYIINEESHTIYYVEGIELKNHIYNCINDESENLTNNIAPTSPQIQVISGNKNWKDIYTTSVQFEFVPGKENVSGIEKTTYSINNGEEIEISYLSENTYEITQDGTYEIKLITYGNNRSKYTN